MKPRSGAGRRVNAGRSAADYLPRGRTLPRLAEAARTCKGCDLHENATQTVFGEGPRWALVMFVGEQPGQRRLFVRDMAELARNLRRIAA